MRWGLKSCRWVELSTRAGWKLRRGRVLSGGSDCMLSNICYERRRYSEWTISQHGREASIMQLMVCMIQWIMGLFELIYIFMTMA